MDVEKIPTGVVEIILGEKIELLLGSTEIRVKKPKKLQRDS